MRFWASKMIGIVILNYKNWNDTRRCVKSIYKNPPKDHYLIILVDNASENNPDYDLKNFIQRYQIDFIANKTNKGYNAGNNCGIQRALELGCDYILISNNDVCYLPQSIQRMRDYLDTNPMVGIVGPRILDTKGHTQKSCIFHKTDLKDKYMVRTRANILFRKQWKEYFGCKKDYEHVSEVYAVLGCCFMMSKLCAQTVTPLDEYPFLYEEELILGIKMNEQRLRTVYDPNAAVKHLHGSSTKHVKAFAFAHNVRSEIYYCRSYLHAKRWQIYPLYAYRILLYLIRCLKYEDFREKWKWFIQLTRKEFYDRQIQNDK